MDFHTFPLSLSLPGKVFFIYLTEILTDIVERWDPNLERRTEYSRDLFVILKIECR